MMVQKCVFIFFAATLFWSQISVKANSSEYAGDSDSCSIQSDDNSDESYASSSDMPTTCEETVTKECTSNVYDYTVKNAYGENVCMSKYQGRVLVIVNYASTCAFTETNVHELSNLAKNYGDKGVTVLVFPSNTFCENEGGNTAAREFADAHPEFDVFSEVCVNGPDEEPLYTYLKSAQPGSLGCSDIQWNFVKFVVDKNGHPVDRYGSVDCTCEGLENSVKHCC